MQEVELYQRNHDIEALIAKIGQQTDKVNQERAVADAEEQKVRARSESGPLKSIINKDMAYKKEKLVIKQCYSLCLCLFIIQVAAIQASVTKQQQDTEADLAKAEPALQAANAALNTLNRVKHF